MSHSPFTPRSDQYLISLYNFLNTLSSRQVMRIEKIINYGILPSYNTKFSPLANKEMYGHQSGELALRSWVWKWLCSTTEFTTKPSITCQLWSLRCIMQNACYLAVNHVTDLLGNKSDIWKGFKKDMFLSCNWWISMHPLYVGLWTQGPKLTVLCSRQIEKSGRQKVVRKILLHSETYHSETRKH